jgi:transposase-like protein
MKLIYLALRNAEKKWRMPLKEWNAAMDQFAIHSPRRTSANRGAIADDTELAT